MYKISREDDSVAGTLATLCLDGEKGKTQFCEVFSQPLN